MTIANTGSLLRRVGTGGLRGLIKYVPAPSQWNQT